MSRPIKEEIIRTAAEMFAKRGYEATGVQELGEAVALGRGALYHHIGSKENLLYEISKRHVFTMVDIGDAIVVQPIPADEKFRALSRALMRMIADNLPEITVFFHEYRSLSPEHSAEIRAIRDRFEEVWQRVLAEGVESGVFRPIHPMLVKGILGLYNYSYLWFEPDGTLTAEQAADLFSEMALSGLRA